MSRLEILIIVALVGAWLACGLAWLAWLKIIRALKPFLAGPPERPFVPGDDLHPALAERQAGERKWRSF